VIIVLQLSHVARKRLQISTDMLLIITSTNKHWQQAFYWLSTSMTLNDLEPQKLVFLVNFFAIFGCDTHLKVNYAEMAGDGPG